MENWILQSESWLRLLGFAGFLCLFAGVEWAWPRRRRRQTRVTRWPLNLGMVVAGSLAMRLAVPLMAVQAALLAQDQGWGLFKITGAPWPLAMLASVILLDLAVYAQHVMFHQVPWLWRIHRMHHSDLDLDVTSGLRFHPLEFVLSMLIKVAVVMALGAPAAAVVVFEILLNATAMFNHANIYLPRHVDWLIRLILVTPDMHIVHHSVKFEESNRNYGFNLSLWDRLFGTYQQAPQEGPVRVTLGQADRQDPARLGLKDLLWMPFAKDRPHPMERPPA